MATERVAGRRRSRRSGRSSRPTADRVAARLAHHGMVSILTLGFTAGSLAAQDVVVGPAGPYTTVTAALEAAEPGARVRILSGTYREGPIRVRKPVRIEGVDWPVLDGGHQGSVLIIEADDVEVRGLRIRNSGVSFVDDHAAIRVDGGNRCVVDGNRLEDNFFGIYVARSEGCRITDNVVRASGDREASSGNGIHLWNARDVRVARNQVRGHRDGIYLEHVRRATIEGNHCEGNLRYGLHFMFSHETEYSGNVFRSNGAGVAVMYSRSVRVADNVFEDNWGATAYGLLLKDISDSEVVGNTFRRNTTALHSEGSDRLEIRGNRFERNGWAVRVLASSQGNRFTGNDFIDNTFDVTTNSRRNYNHFEGNYWSAYRGYDLTGDGVGDVPYRPLRLFALIVERTPEALALLRGPFVDLLDVAERVLPAITPETLVDASPRMTEVTR
ncbi:MAG TPA: nitrous oxide reductase family maturation protein NosD [Longimicrobiales bacterium]|nr:nitrous oxide reductase family maturation protein NosD [Longimicrobiales bacterium]